MTDESGTPQTDNASFLILSPLQSGTEEVVKASFAESLERERDQLRADLAMTSEECGYRMKERDEAREQAEAWRRDAERYRWLRPMNNVHGSHVYVAVDTEDGVMYPDAAEVDAAIDAAIFASGEGNV